MHIITSSFFKKIISKYKFHNIKSITKFVTYAAMLPFLC